MRRKPVRSSEKKFCLFQGFCLAVGSDKISTDKSTRRQRLCCGEMSEDSGGAVMGRGGRSADPQRLASFLASTRDWGKEQDGPLEADQFESDCCDDGSDKGGQGGE